MVASTSRAMPMSPGFLCSSGHAVWIGDLHNVVRQAACERFQHFLSTSFCEQTLLIGTAGLLSNSLVRILVHC